MKVSSKITKEQDMEKSLTLQESCRRKEFSQKGFLLLLLKVFEFLFLFLLRISARLGFVCAFVLN